MLINKDDCPPQWISASWIMSQTVAETEWVTRVMSQ